MKRIFFTVLLLVLLPRTAFPQEERILSYLSEIRVQPAGDMEVTETITVVSQGDRIKHGIYRDFPTRYQDEYGNIVRVEEAAAGRVAGYAASEERITDVCGFDPPCPPIRSLRRRTDRFIGITRAKPWARVTPHCC